MKIRLICKEETYAMYQSMLEKAGLEIDFNASLEFRETKILS